MPGSQQTRRGRQDLDERQRDVQLVANAQRSRAGRLGAVENVAATRGDAAFPDPERDGSGLAERDPDRRERRLDASDDRSGEQQRQVEQLRHCAPLLAERLPESIPRLDHCRSPVRLGYRGQHATPTAYPVQYSVVPPFRWPAFPRHPCQYLRSAFAPTDQLPQRGITAPESIPATDLPACLSTIRRPVHKKFVISHVIEPKNSDLGPPRT